MLKRLLNRLHIIMTGILTVLITLILSFSFWNTYQSAQTADVTYIQRMASLIIYQLEADTEQPETVLSDYLPNRFQRSFTESRAKHRYRKCCRLL